jgi:hypothetical protein
MRASLAAAALVGLQGCVYYVHPSHKADRDCDRRDYDDRDRDRDCEDRNDRPDWGDDEDDREDPSEAVLIEGVWVFELTAPVLEGRCDSIDLGGLDYFAAQGRVVRTGEQEYAVDTPFSEHALFIDGEAFFGEGYVSYDDTEVFSLVEGTVRGRAELQGVAYGETDGCLISATLYGYALD